MSFIIHFNNLQGKQYNQPDDASNSPTMTQCVFYCHFCWCKCAAMLNLLQRLMSIQCEQNDMLLFLNPGQRY